MWTEADRQGPKGIICTSTGRQPVYMGSVSWAARPSHLCMQRTAVEYAGTGFVYQLCMTLIYCS